MNRTKNMKNHIAAKLISLLTAALLVFTAVPMNVSAATAIPIETTSGVAVEGNTNNASFDVNLKTNTDVLLVYKIGQVTWNETSHVYENPEWINQLNLKLVDTGNEAYRAIGDTPAMLGAPDKDDSQRTEFYKWVAQLIETRSLMIEPVAGELKQGQTPSNRASGYTNISYNDESHVARVSNLSYGMYIVLATDGVNSYAPLSMNVVPMRQGPDDSFYAPSNLVGTLKGSGVQVLKLQTVNNHERTNKDTAAIGDNIIYDIYADVPDYTEYVQNDDYSKTWFNLVDTMAHSFTYKSASDVSVGYITGTDNKYKKDTVYTNLSADDYTLLFAQKAANSSSTGLQFYATYENTSAATPLGDALVVANVTATTGSNYTVDFYSYLPERGLIKVIQKGATVNNTYMNNALANLDNFSATFKANVAPNCGTTYDVPGLAFKRTATNTWQDLQVISFDYEKLQDKGAKVLKVTYEAEVNATVEVGTDGNTNTATFKYMGDAAGSKTNLEQQDNTVIIWSYGINLIKKDGNNSTTYLDGAKFHVYKEAFTFVPKDSTISTIEHTQASYENYVFHSFSDGTKALKSPSTGESKKEVVKADGWEDSMYPEAEATNNDVIRIKTLYDAERSTTDYYFRLVKYDSSNTNCGVEECPCKGSVAHYHVIAYSILEFYERVEDPTGQDKYGVLKTDNSGQYVTNTVLTSVNSDKGIAIKGLAPGHYAMVEFEAPTDYNLLTEAIVFEIHAYADDKDLLFNSELHGADAQTYTDNGFVASSSTIGTPETMSQKFCYSEVYHSGDGNWEDSQLKVFAGTLASPTAKAYLYEDGMYPIVVKNYKGVTLPSTGGMGTLLFTIIGIVLMILVMVIVILKRRENDYTSQF